MTALCIGKWEIVVRKIPDIYEAQVYGNGWSIADYQYSTDPFGIFAWLAPGSMAHRGYMFSDRVKVRIWSPDKKKQFVYIGFLDKAWHWWADHCLETVTSVDLGEADHAPA